MSKQSNQRYRKEKEKEHLKKAGISDSAEKLNKLTRDETGAKNSSDSASNRA